MSLGLVFIQEKCNGCRLCEAACRSVDEEAGFRSRVFLDFRGQGLSYVFLTCVQCRDPPCVEACPTSPKSLLKHGDGVVTVERGRCIACGYCAMACPYGAIWVPSSLGAAVKCDMCRGRTEKDDKPACVEKCSTGALRVGGVRRKGLSSFTLNLKHQREKKKRGKKKRKGWY